MIYGGKAQGGIRYTNYFYHSNSLSKKMSNCLLAVKDINHKYIVGGSIMNKIVKKVSIMMLTLVLICNVFCTTVSANSRITVYNKGEWKVYLDSPDSAKSYYHLHFYQNSKHIYCLRLDNMNPCDGTKNNKDNLNYS